MKRFFKVIAIFMVVILCVGSISTLFDIGGSEPTGPGTTVQRPTENPGNTEEPGENEEPDVPDVPGEEPDEPVIPACTHVDADDNSVCDKCGEAFSDGQDLFGGTVINNVDFSSSMTKDALNGISDNVVQNGYSVGGVSVGYISTESGSLHYETRAEDVVNSSGAAVNIHFGIHNETKQGSVHPVAKEDYDYITIDFDISTETQYFYRMTFKIQGKDFFGNQTVDDYPYFEIIRRDGEYYLCIYDGGIVDICTFENASHITFVIDTKDNLTKLYLDGEYIYEKENNQNLEYLVYLRAYFPSGFVEDGCSVDFDNYTVSTFGNGDGTYSGAIDRAFNDRSINLTECVDSVLYNKNN